jgi:hypothetical protein
VTLTLFPLQHSGFQDFGENVFYRLYDDLFGEGVVGENDLKVEANGTPAMRVNVLAGTGYVDFDTPEGGKRWLYNSATSDSGLPGAPGTDWETTFTAAHGTNPRIDRVVAKAYDGLVDSGGLYGPKLAVVAGTATGGATLANLTGAAAVPANSILLANVLIPAAATTIPNSNIDTLGDGFMRVRPRARTADVFCQITRAAAQSLGTSGTAAAVTFDTQDQDADSMWAASGSQGGVTFNGTQIMARTPGYYLIRGHAEFAFHATGARRIEVKNEAATVIGRTTAMAVTATDATVVPFATGPVLLGAAANTRFFTVEAMQRSGGALNLTTITVWAHLIKHG